MTATTFAVSPHPVPAASEPLTVRAMARFNLVCEVEANLYADCIEHGRTEAAENHSRMARRCARAAFYCAMRLHRASGHNVLARGYAAREARRLFAERA